MKFCPGAGERRGGGGVGEVSKKLVPHVSFNLGQSRYLFYFISPQDENVFANICGIFYKNCFTEKVNFVSSNRII